MTERAEQLYQKFVESFFAKGETEIPADWPEEVKERCLFFLRVLESGEARAFHQSTLAILNSEGVKATLSLAGEADLPEALSEGDERYVVENEIASGGMGKILIAYDRDLRRRVAVKVMRPETMTPATKSRFLEESQATAQLEHPNIAPLYDVGVRGDGSPFFTMKWIRGRDLDEVLRSEPQEMSLIRLLQILGQAAMGVDFANSRNVVHRDLKPQNIMVGDYGAVLVVDWGLARILHRESTDETTETPSTLRAEGGMVTLDGTVQGSLPFMAPEQARGEVSKIDARTDVFGLGSVLYQILTGCPPYEGSSVNEFLLLARGGCVVAPAVRAPERNIPPQLESVCVKALAARQEDRFQSAREFHEALQNYVEGIHDAERRDAEATRLLALADEKGAEFHSMMRKESELRRQVETEREEVQTYEGEEKKEKLWLLSGRLKRMHDQNAHVFNEVTSAYHSVLSVQPRHARARRALAELFRERLIDAEVRGEAESSQLYEGLVRQYDDGSFAGELNSERWVELASEPPGARVLVSRYEERGPMVAESEPEDVGVTPLRSRLRRGSYVAIFRKEGYCDVRYPFLVERSPPQLGAVRLHPAGSVPEGFVQIPAGRSIVGTQLEAIIALERSPCAVGEFFVGRFPVTFGEYCRWLNERASSLQSEGLSATELLERLADSLPAFGRERYVAFDDTRGFAPLECLDPRMPVIGVSSNAVEGYGTWLGKELRQQVRVPWELEWERCARGADGRFYPWGNDFDFALCKGGRSQPGEPFPEPVGEYARDVSPFGVRDLAGGVRELCADLSAERDRVIRGGSWSQFEPVAFGAFWKTYLREGKRNSDVGFRVCYAVDQG